MLRGADDIEEIDLGGLEMFGEELVRARILVMDGEPWLDIRIWRRLPATGERVPTDSGLLLRAARVATLSRLVADAEGAITEGLPGRLQKPNP